ncbi:MAG: Zn-dependent oligopeptidase [Deltaproteobacteria bacterium]|nr:Zn-dependent oligopeptidase [Deltaproteobacteria bacterium]
MTLHPNAAEALFVKPEVLNERAREAIVEAKRSADALRALPAGAPGDEAMRLWDAATAAIGNASAVASVARNAHPDQKMREAAEKAEQELEDFASTLSLDPALHRALESSNADALDPATRFYRQRTLQNLRKSGVDKDDATRARLRAIHEELVKVGQEFSRNIIEDVRKVALEPRELQGLPDDWIRARKPGPDGKIVVTTDPPDYVPFISYAQDRGARERLWRETRLRGHPKNLGVLQRMLELRHEQAQIVGYPHWAALATDDKMIGSADRAREFIEKIAAAATPRSDSEIAELREEGKRGVLGDAPIEPWDAEVLKEAVRKRRFAFDAQAARAYFEFGRVQSGLLALAAKLFGVEFARVETPVWHASVTAWDVLEQGVRVGRFYLDLHPREGKYKHAAQFSLANGQAGLRLPEAVLMCNFPGPTAPDGGPALLEHSDVVTYFHEFGHLMHHLLGGRVRWAGQSGVATEWDFVEAPSQMLEEWTWDADVLQGFAKHHATGEPIPRALVGQMRAAQEFGKGLQVKQQMFYAAVSLAFHDRDPRGLDTTRTMAELQSRFAPFRYVEGTYFHESFGHLEGYSALYYTYMWSLVIAKDLFGVFRAQGLLDPRPAQKYRRAILEPGGSKPAAQLVRDFLGRDSDFRAWEEWLARD